MRAKPFVLSKNLQKVSVTSQVISPHLGEVKTIEKLRQMRAEGKSHGGLGDWLNVTSIRSKNGGRWDRPTVYKMLKRASVTLPECEPQDPNDRPPR